MFLKIPVDQLFLDFDASLTEGLAVLQRGQRQIALVTGADGLLKGILTDGDVRRAMLTGENLESPVNRIMVTNFVKAGTADSREDITKLMKKHKVQHIPILDKGKPVDVAWINELMLDEDELDMQAVIMAGGFGKRLRPLTKDIPKPMLTLQDKPLSHHLLTCLIKSGLNKVTFTTHYKYQKLIEYFSAKDFNGCQLDFVIEKSPMGTAGGLSLLNDKSQTTLVVNGDILTRIDYLAMYQFHQEQNAYLTMAASNHVCDIQYGVVSCNGSRVLKVEEKPSYNFLINAGIYILSPQALADIPAGKRYDMTELIQDGLDSGRNVVCFPILEYWRDIGLLSDFKQASLDILSI